MSLLREVVIEMGGFSVVLLKKNIKNINLRIKRTGIVQISAPVKMSMDTIYRFLHDKRSWIELHQERLKKIPQELPKNIIAGALIPFQGRMLALQIFETNCEPYIHLHENQIHFFLKANVSEQYKEQFLKKWYYSQIQENIEPLIRKWQLAIGVHVNTTSIRSMKSRWGSCHPIRKHITLNLRLIEKPLICLEYVIVHELIHLLEASHNRRFYALMERFYPNWKEVKKLM